MLLPQKDFQCECFQFFWDCRFWCSEVKGHSQEFPHQIRPSFTRSSGILLVVVVASHDSVHHQSQEIIQGFPSAGTWYREPCWELAALLPEEPGARFSSRVVLFYPPKHRCSGRVALLQWTLDFWAGPAALQHLKSSYWSSAHSLQFQRSASWRGIGSIVGLPTVSIETALCCERIQLEDRRSSTNLVQRSSVALEMI